MAGITRVNGFGQYAQGSVYSVAQLKAFLIKVGVIKVDYWMFSTIKDLYTFPIATTFLIQMK